MAKRKKVVLVVDDEPAIRQVLRRTLSGARCVVLEAEDGFQAMRVFSKEKPDMVLLDVNIPGMSGLSVLRRIKRIRKSADVVLLTGFGDIEDAKRAMRLGARDYLTKPFELKQLEPLLR